MNAVPGREPQHSELEATTDDTHSDTVDNPGHQNLTLAADWRLQAARLAGGDALLDSLVIAAAELDRPTTAAALKAGLPIPITGITPELFIRAADRIDLSARLVRQPLKRISALTTPCVVLLNDGRACVVTSRLTNGRFVVVFPETGTPQQLELGQINDDYAGYCFFLQPKVRYDSRTTRGATDTKTDWFWSTISRFKGIYAEVALAAIVVNLFALASPLFIMNVYDRVIPNNAFDTLWVLALGAAVAFGFDFLLRTLRSYFVDVAGRHADRVMAARLFSHVMDMQMASRPASAGALAGHVREFDTLREFFTSASLIALIDFPFTILFVLLVWLIGGPLAIVPAVAVPIVLIVGRVLQVPLARVMSESLRQSAQKSSTLVEAISGLNTIKVQGAEGEVQRRWEEIVDGSAATWVRARTLASFGLNFSMLIHNLTTIAIIILGAHLAAEGMITVGALIACVILSNRAMAPLTQMAGVLTRLQQSRAALHSLNDMMQTPVERPTDKSFVSRPVINGDIEFRNVDFRYPDQTANAVERLNIRIQAGEKVGIIGGIGTGKSTLQRLLLNLYQPDHGSVLVDGLDVRQLDPADLRSNIGTFEQEPYLFYGSIRDNIALGHKGIDDGAVLRAAEAAGVLDFVKHTENGLDLPLAERGTNLSGGQRHAVALARTMLLDPPVLVLDEPTGSMDPATEGRFKDRLRDLMTDKTMILITHRGSMLSLVDRLIVMDSGRIIADGPRQAVIDSLRNRQVRSARPTGAGQ